MERYCQSMIQTIPQPLLQQQPKKLITPTRKVPQITIMINRIAHHKVIVHPTVNQIVEAVVLEVALTQMAEAHQVEVVPPEEVQVPEVPQQANQAINK